VTEPTTPYAASAFDAKIVSNTYDTDKGCWVIKFDNTITSIGYGAFRVCTSLTSVTIPNSVTSIGDYAFGNCELLTSVTIGNGVTSIDGNPFLCCPSLTAFYGKYASEDNRCLIVDGVLYSFAMAELTEYTIPDGVTEIGDYAFGECTSLTSVTIPDSVTSIGDYAFGECTSLTSVTIPNSVISVGRSAFAGCTSLKAFYGKFASSDNRCLIVDGVLNSFAIGCGATEYTIPDSVTEIGECAFYGCRSLKSVTIPDSVTEIGEGAFADTWLTSVAIGNGVTSIGMYAFESCISLKEVYCKPITPPAAIKGYSGYWEAFESNASDRKIYVPRNSVEAYKAAEYWSNYADSIVGYDF
ncbi:MAG: leucine-rich repeat domain-containing protein, partial [Rikenellaceae bacterium]|nr:leucine-rich repeat domain-containing protein [Rikenellaceae bacterium]